jgi:hypothetical protein
MVEVSWLVENHIILWYDKGRSTIEGGRQVEPQVLQMLEDSPAALVHVVFDYRDLTEMPSLADNIRANYQFPTHPKFGWVALVGMTDPMQRMIVSMLGGIFKARMRLVPNTLAALEYLESVDANLPDLSAYKKQAASKV